MKETLHDEGALWSPALGESTDIRFGLNPTENTSATAAAHPPRLCGLYTYHWDIDPIADGRPPLSGRTRERERERGGDWGRERERERFGEREGEIRKGGE